MLLLYCSSPVSFPSSRGILFRVFSESEYELSKRPLTDAKTVT